MLRGLQLLFHKSDLGFEIHGNSGLGFVCLDLTLETLDKDGLLIQLAVLAVWL